MGTPLSAVPPVTKLATKTLPKTNFDKILDGVSVLLVPGIAALMIKTVYRGNRV